MIKIYNILKNFDIYGYNFRLRYKKEIEYSTFCGIFFSLISISIILTISISHILKMINGTNFTIVTNYIYINNIEINLSSYPLLFGLYKYTDLIGYDPSYIKLRLDRNEHIPIKDGNYQVERNSYSIELEKCSLNYFSEYIHLFNNSNLDYNKYYCVKPNQNLTIKGHYGDKINGYTTLEFHLIKCENKTENNNHCKSPEEIDKYLENTFIAIIYVSKNIDHFNKNNPIYSFINSDSFSITSLMLKDIIIFFLKKNILVIMELF